MSASSHYICSSDKTLPITPPDVKATGHYQVRYPERWRAHYLVGKALRSGRLAKPLFCNRCLRVRKTEAHHPDYKKPLKVQWLCRQCHSYIHPKTQKNAGAVWLWQMRATADDMATAMARARS